MRAKINKNKIKYIIIHDYMGYGFYHNGAEFSNGELFVNEKRRNFELLQLNNMYDYDFNKYIVKGKEK